MNSVVILALAAFASAQAENAPYQGLLELSHHMPGLRSCGGTLIDPQYLLTAASCIHKAESGHVSLGVTRLHGTPAVYRKIEKIIVHHEFYNGQNDIALIRLAGGPVPSDTRGVQIISLGHNTTVGEGSTGTLSGWPQSPSSDLLVKPRVTVNSCNNDSDVCAYGTFCVTAGSALVIDNELVGVSKDPEYCDGTVTFTKVSDYLEWIVHHIHQ